MNFIGLLFAVFAIMGSVLGAGFMSGTEIYGFFARFGNIAYITIAINAVIFGLFVCIYGLKTAKSSIFMGDSIQKNKVLYFCQLLITGTMIAGANTLLVGFGVPAMASFWLILAFVFICNLLGIKSANFFNCLVTTLAIVSFAFICYDGKWQALQTSNNVVVPLILVVFYLVMNIAGSEPIVKRVCENKRKKQIVLIGVFSSLFLIATLYLLVGLVGDGTMPLVAVIKNSVFKKVYSVVVMLAMFSTMLGSSLGAKRLFNLGNFLNSFFATILAGIISFVGFKNMVYYVYPTIGVLLFLDYFARHIKRFLENV